MHAPISCEIADTGSAVAGLDAGDATGEHARAHGDVLHPLARGVRATAARPPRCRRSRCVRTSDIVGLRRTRASGPLGLQARFQPMISGMSSPYRAMYALCSMSASGIACLAHAAFGPSFGTRPIRALTRWKRRGRSARTCRTAQRDICHACCKRRAEGHHATMRARCTTAKRASRWSESFSRPTPRRS